MLIHLQGCRESNSGLRFWRPPCCRNTSPLRPVSWTGVAAISRTRIRACSQRRVPGIGSTHKFRERLAGIEPALTLRQSVVMPFHYSRIRRT